MDAFLSASWLEDLASRIASVGPLDSPMRLALGQLVTGTPTGDIAYTLLVGGGEPSEIRCGLEDATVTIVEEYDAAVAIASGTPVSDLLAAGRVKIRGATDTLLEAQGLLADVGALLVAPDGSACA